MYAIVRTGGKQYRVEAGRSVTVERLPAAEGETVELRDVLLIGDGADVTVGAPTVDGARVVAEVESQGRAPKVVVFKYKAKVRYRRKRGHRQPFTRLTVREILRPGEDSRLAPKPARRRRRATEEAEEPGEGAEAPVAGAPAEAAPERPTRRRRLPTVEAAVPEVEVPEAPKPRRRTRPAKAEQPEEPPAASADETTSEERPRARRRNSEESEQEETE